MSDIQKIKLKRTQKTLANSKTDAMDFGEPYIVGAGQTDTYISVGMTDSSTVASAKIVKCLPVGNWGGVATANVSDYDVFYTGSTGAAGSVQLRKDDSTELMPLTTAGNVSFDENANYSNNTLGKVVKDVVSGAESVPNADFATSSTTATNSNNLKTTSATTGTYYILGVTDTNTDTNKQVYHAAAYSSATENTTGIKFNNTGVLFGAAWNDFAEFRKCFAVVPGTCVVEKGDGSLEASEAYLLPAASIITDTFGMVIGNDEEDSRPIAVAGRVLAFVENKDKLSVGDALKTAPAGKLAKMTRREIRKYPDRIVGYVSEFPSYEEWNGVEVNDRIWVKIK